MKNPKIIVISGGFYYFGDLVTDHPKEGYVCIREAAMFGGFGGDKGLPGVTRGDKESTVILDIFDKNETQFFPESACFGILSCIDLYKFKGATVR